jgi:hypothetical protein
VTSITLSYRCYYRRIGELGIRRYLASGKRLRGAIVNFNVEDAAAISQILIRKGI